MGLKWVGDAGLVGSLTLFYHSHQVQMQTATYFTSDVLRGDEQTELRVRLVRYLEEEAPPADD